MMNTVTDAIMKFIYLCIGALLVATAFILGSPFFFVLGFIIQFVMASIDTGRGFATVVSDWISGQSK